MRSDTACVLVIDDDGNARTLLHILLDHHGYATLLAPDGETGLMLAETQRPDVIVLDVAMPYRSGMDVYLELQNNPSTATIPVIICSAALSEREKAIWWGMHNVREVMTKPFDIGKLLDLTSQLCQLQLRVAV